jgi:electron transport complex protein RnfD
MALLRVTSPHAHAALDTTTVMQSVLLATLPGVAAMTWFFGPGTLVNILVASVTAILMEAAALRLRGRPVLKTLDDHSAVVTAVLLGISLPPYAPWWLIVIGIGAAIWLAKHLYGGLGYNPFNPAMVGYVVLLISFPVQMTAWAPPRGLVEELPSIMDALRACFLPTTYDGVTAATALDIVKQNRGELLTTLWAQSPELSHWAGRGWEWVSLAFLAGGLWMLRRGLFTWHAPVAMLAAITLLSALFYADGSSASHGSPLFHLLGGATLFGAFFIITDPVSSAVSRRGRLIYGAAIGVLVYTIRVAGNYPDAVAFAVLIMNFAAPFIDHYTQPRTYGHGRRPQA